MVTAIDVLNVSRHFWVEPAQRSRSLKNTLLGGWRKISGREEFWALRNLTFSIPSGKTVGIIGGNGAGKSTLLRLIAGLGRPDSGDVLVNGHLAALLELGAGFHPDLTGRENLYTSAIVSGLTKHDLDAGLVDQIIAFAELEAFIDNPLRTYSAGMAVRLAFAIAIHVNPDILLIDEVLAVGDIHFQQKCLDRVNEFRRMGKTIVLVSHDLSAIESLCDTAIWLHKGQLVAQGPAPVIVDRYKATNASAGKPAVVDAELSAASSLANLIPNENRFGSHEVEITTVRLLNKAGQITERIETGEELTVELTYIAHQPIVGPIFGVSFARTDGVRCFDTSTQADNIHIAAINGRGMVRVRFDTLALLPGSYRFDVGVYKHDWAYAYDYHWQAYLLEVWSNINDTGIFRPPHQWSHQTLPTLEASTAAIAEERLVAIEES
jgi:lipopolysaccharide transport system ATP-binding protein